MRNHVRVHTYHGHLLFGYFSKIKTRTIILIEKLLSNFTDALISVGNSVKEELIASGIGKEEKFHTIRPGIDFDSLLLSTSSDVELGITNEDFVVVWIGRFAEIKRPDRLLEIAKLAKSRGVKTKFLAVGDGILRKVIESESRSLNLNIDFLGWRTDVGSILRSADLLVLTSDNEGTPIVIMEAQVLGVPVVACDVGSVKEIVVNGQTGFVDDYNGEKFLNLIQKLNNEPGLLEHMSSNAGDFAQSEFTVKNFISSHENLYLELLSKKFGKTRDL
jgi:glycosyltransferase involved in cell wall biosynthesis